MQKKIRQLRKGRKNRSYTEKESEMKWSKIDHNIGIL